MVRRADPDPRRWCVRGRNAFAILIHMLAVLGLQGTHKAYALAKCIEEGVNHMFTVSAIQLHPKVRLSYYHIRKRN